MKLIGFSIQLKDGVEGVIAELIVDFNFFVCLAGQMVLNRNATHGWQIKKPSRTQPINGVLRTCNGSRTLMDQGAEEQKAEYRIHAVETTAD